MVIKETKACKMTEPLGTVKSILGGPEAPEHSSTLALVSTATYSLASAAYL